MVPSFSVAGISASAPSFYIDHRQVQRVMSKCKACSISCSKNSTITTSRLFDGISDLCSDIFVL